MQVFFGEANEEFLGRSLWQKTKSVGKKAGRVTGKAVKATVTAPSKVLTKTVKVVATPIIGKKATSYLTKTTNLVSNPLAQAKLARTGTQKVIGKSGYKALTKSALNPVKNPSLYASAVSNFIVPGSGLAVASALKTGSALKSNFNKAKGLTRNVKSVIRPLAKAGSSFLPDRTPTQNISDIVQRNLPQITVPQEKAEEIQKTDEKIKNNLPLIIGAIAVVGFLVSRKK